MKDISDMAFTVEWYQGNEAEWDRFIQKESMNGLFLQTRQFINYHPKDRFTDKSICVRKGNALVCAILACEIEDNGKKILFSHKGTTFGGIVVSKQIYASSSVNELFESVLSFVRDEGYDGIYLKQVSDIYQKENTDLIDYFFYKYGFRNYSELNFYMNLDRYKDDIPSQFTSSKRRDYRYSLKNELCFRELFTKEEIADYYQVLRANLNKLNLPAVHTLEDLYDLKFNRFADSIRFFGVYYENRIIAGSMIFLFHNRVFHTQYLSSDENYLKLFPMDYLIENLISTAIQESYDVFSFGICTEDQGRYLNFGLARFKEGFGAEYCINHSYELLFDEKQINEA